MLRRATERDVDALHALLRVPEVYRFLCDGVAPPRSAAEEWIALNRPTNSSPGLGLWLLEAGSSRLAGSVALEPGTDSRTAELDYVLHPEHWGRGLATRASWTIVESALGAVGLEAVVAGTDVPNRASVDVMRRLGMRFLRDVTYPLGPGVQYVRRRGDPPPELVPEPIAWSDPERDPPSRS